MAEKNLKLKSSFLKNKYLDYDNSLNVNENIFIFCLTVII